MKDVQKAMPHSKHYLGQFSYPKPYPMEVPPPKWGLYNPPNYEEPARFNHFPPIKYNGYWNNAGFENDWIDIKVDIYFFHSEKCTSVIFGVFFMFSGFGNGVFFFFISNRDDSDWPSSDA